MHDSAKPRGFQESLLLHAALEQTPGFQSQCSLEKVLGLYRLAIAAVASEQPRLAGDAKAMAAQALVWLCLWNPPSEMRMR